MPELPEVETVRRTLADLIIGKTIADVEILWSKIVINDDDSFKEILRGKTILGIDRRGKYLLFRLSDDLTILSHLRMEGNYQLATPSVTMSKHTHVIFNFTDGTQLRYSDSRKFGRMRLLHNSDVESVKALQKLGPEPKSATFKKDEFYQGLQRHKKAIKPLLLDQTLVTGLGNIYADEVLWLAFIHPETPANQLTREQADFLHDAIIEELNLATEQGGTTVHSYLNAKGETGHFQSRLHVYGRTDEPCDRCQTPIVKIKLAQRGTHFCPSCQKLGQVRFK